MKKPIAIIGEAGFGESSLLHCIEAARILKHSRNDLKVCVANTTPTNKESFEFRIITFKFKDMTENDDFGMCGEMLPTVKLNQVVDFWYQGKVLKGSVKSIGKNNMIDVYSNKKLYFCRSWNKEKKYYDCVSITKI